MKLKSHSFYSFCVGILALAAAVVMGDSIAGDFSEYRRNYYNPRIKEPIFFYLNISFSKILSFELFYIIIGLVQIYALNRIRLATQTSFFCHLIALSYLVGVGFFGHWRQSIAVMFIAYFGLKYRAFILASLTHFSFFISTIFFIGAKWMFLIFICTLTGYFLVRHTELFDFIFITIDKERFLLSFKGYYNDYYEHRNLFYFRNPQLWIAIIIISTCYFARHSNQGYTTLLLIPYASYLIFSFDAYVAQKTYLALSFLAPYAVSSFASQKVRFLITFLLFIDLATSGICRFAPCRGILF